MSSDSLKKKKKLQCSHEFKTRLNYIYCVNVKKTINKTINFYWLPKMIDSTRDIDNMHMNS